MPYGPLKERILRLKFLLGKSHFFVTWSNVRVTCSVRATARRRLSKLNLGTFLPYNVY